MAEQPTQGQRVNVIAPDGTRGTVPIEGLAEARTAGYEVLSDEQVTKARSKEKYGDSEVAAGAAGLARGATLGLSDVALTQTGLVDPETLSGLKRENPLTSTGSELVGNVAPFLIPGGGIAAGAAKLAPARLASELGMGATRLAEKGLASALGDASIGIAESALGRGLTTGVGSAIEGAAYGAGTAISEDALGDTELNAESFLTHVGLGALFGGVLGGGMGAMLGKSGQRLGSRLDEAMPDNAAAMADDAAVAARGRQLGEDISGEMPRAGKVADDAIDKTVEAGMGAAEEEAFDTVIEGALGEKPVSGVKKIVAQVLDSKLGRGITEQIGTLANVQDDAVRDLMLSAESREAAASAKKVKDEAIPELAKAFDQIHAATDMVQDEARGVLKVNQVKRAVQTGNEAEVAKSALGLMERLESQVAFMKSKATRFGNVGAIDRTEALVKDFGAEIRRAIGGEKLEGDALRAAKEFGGDVARTNASQNAEVFVALDQLKRKLGSKKLAKFGMFAGSADNETAQVIREMYEQELMPFLERQELWGDAATLQKNLNKSWTAHLQRHSVVQDMFWQKLGTDAEGQFFGASTKKIGAFLDQLSDPRNSTDNQQLQYWLDHAGELMSTVKKEFQMEGKGAGQVDDALAAIKAIRERMGTVENTVVKANQLREITKSAPYVGHILTRLTAIERATQSVGTKIKSSINEFVKGNERAVRGASEDIRSEIRSATDRLRGASEDIRSEIRSATDRLKGEPKSARPTAAESAAAVPTDKSGKTIYPYVGAASTLFGSIESRRHAREKGDNDRVGMYKAQVKTLQKMMADAPGVQSQMAKNLNSVQQAAPKMAVALNIKGNQALQFLYGKIAPGLPNPAVPALMNAYRPMDSEITTFERYARVLSNPMTAIDDLKSRRLTFEAVDGLKAVYPKIYNEVVKYAAEAVSDTDKPMAYRDRIQLSLLLGTPLDPTLDPGYLGMVQSSTGMSSPDAPQGGGAPSPGRKPRVSGLDDFKKSTNLATQSQRLEENA